MAGLRKIARMYGGLVAKGGGKTVTYGWDEKKDGPVVESVVADAAPDIVKAPSKG